LLHVAPPPNPDNGTGVPAPIVSQYLKQLTILPVRGTRLVSVQFTTPDPKLSAAVANAHAQLFVKAGLERLYESMDQIRTFLQTKLAELQTRMQEAETKLMKFQAAHNLLPVVLQKDVASERLMDLSKRLTEAQGQLFALEAEYQIVERGNYDSLPAVLHSPLIQNLRENYDRLEVEHALLALKFRPTYPPLRQLSGQLDHAHKLFLILSAVTWLLLGTGIAFLRESSDLTIRDARDIHRATGLGTLAVVPNFDGVLGERNARLRRALGAAAGLVRFGSGNGHTN